MVYKRKISIKYITNSVFKEYLVLVKTFYLSYHAIDKHPCWIYKKIKKN